MPNRRRGGRPEAIGKAVSRGGYAIILAPIMKDAGPKTPTSAVVWIPPDSIWETIQAIRRRYDRHLSRWMPHVTLLYPFRPREQFDQMEPLLYEACAKLPLFQAELKEV